MKTKLLPLFLSILFLMVLSVIQNNSFAQARLMMGATATYINISGGTSGTPIYLVIANPANDAITRAAGHIISEGEYNYVKWMNTTPLSYTIPFGYSNTFYLPFTFNKTAGGAADLRLSTWASAANNTTWASTVTNMYDATYGQDGADEAVIDRWWAINVGAASTANLTFSYRGAENTTDATNGGASGNFGAQRWNGTNWEAPIGSNAGQIPACACVGSVTANGVSNFSPWVLSKLLAPLPVEFLDLSSECERGEITIKWSTATEQNADYFTLERSIDGNNFSSVATVQAAGNSSSTQYYSAVDADAYSGTSYYRVKETDFNGNYIYSSTITVNGCSNNISMAVYPNPSLGSFNVAVAGGKDDEVIIVVVDMLGQVFYSNVSILSTDNEIIAVDPAQQLAAGVYTVIATSKDEILKKKIVIQ